MTKYQKLAERFIKERFSETPDDFTREFAKVRLRDFARYLDQQKDKKECCQLCDGMCFKNSDGTRICNCHKEDKKEKIEELDLRKLLSDEPDKWRDLAIRIGNMVDKINEIIRQLNNEK